MNDDNNPDPWRPLRKISTKISKKTYLKEVQQFLDRGKSQHYAENVTFNVLLPVSRRLRRTYLACLKWTRCIRHDTSTRHRKVIKTLGRFVEDNMDFDEAAESAVAKRKFLSNRLHCKSERSVLALKRGSFQ